VGPQASLFRHWLLDQLVVLPLACQLQEHDAAFQHNREVQCLRMGLKQKPSQDAEPAPSRLVVLLGTVGCAGVRFGFGFEIGIAVAVAAAAAAAAAEPHELEEAASLEQA